VNLLEGSGISINRPKLGTFSYISNSLLKSISISTENLILKLRKNSISNREFDIEFFLNFNIKFSVSFHQTNLSILMMLIY
jgi:hypothetical protein